jgi:ribonuclease P protein component
MRRAVGSFGVPACAAAIVAAVAVVYRGSLSAYFFEDDFQWLAGSLTYDPASVFQLAGRGHFYRPVIELYFWGATPTFGGSPVLFHAANVVLHALNGCLFFLLACQIAGRLVAFCAAVFFVVIPGYIEAVTWVGALAEPVGAMFGLLSMLGLLAHRTFGGVVWRILSVATFLLSLLTHESSVVFLPMLILADWAAGRHPLVPSHARDWLRALRSYLPYVMVLAGYLLVDYLANRGIYLVEEGHYRAGLHAVSNTLSYIVSLYVGKRNIASYVAIVAALVLIAARGSRRVRFAAAWMLMALLPFVFFEWDNVSRYQYLPAMGFALLLAEGVGWLHQWLATRVGPRQRAAILALVVAVIAIRFGVFATKAVANFSVRADAYRQFAARVRQAHPQLQPYDAVIISREEETRLTYRYLEALIRWEYRDPTLRLVVRGE